MKKIKQNPTIIIIFSAALYSFKISICSPINNIEITITAPLYVAKNMLFSPSEAYPKKANAKRTGASTIINEINLGSDY